MSVTNNALTKFFVGTQTPASVLADYQANGITWTEVGHVRDMGTIEDSVTAVKSVTIGDARERTLKGTRTGGELTITCEADPTDTGQIAMQAAFRSTTRGDYVFKVVLPDVPANGTHGTTYFYSGAVLSAARKLAGPNDMIEVAYKIAVNSDVLELAAA